MGPIAEAAFAAMMALAPPERMAALPQWAGHEETVVEKRSRYVAIAIDLEDAVLASEPLPGMNRRRTAATLLGIAFMESGFARDADVGPCATDKRCDRGASACLMQIKVGGGTTREGWTREELFADRTKCFRAGLAKARNSMRACDGELTAYAVGHCDSLIGKAAGRSRLAMGRRVWALGPWAP